MLVIFKGINHALNLDNFPEPGSKAASMFTIDSNDMSDLTSPSFAGLFQNFMPSFLTKHLLKSSTEKHGRDISESKVSDSEITRLTKRRCMDGSDQVDHVAGIPTQVKFIQILHDTEV